MESRRIAIPEECIAVHDTPMQQRKREGKTKSDAGDTPGAKRTRLPHPEIRNQRAPRIESLASYISAFLLIRVINFPICLDTRGKAEP